MNSSSSSSSSSSSPSSSSASPQILIIMGVSGCGKSLVGNSLSLSLSLPFIEGDTLHPIENINKMKNNHPLSDYDRIQWLNKIIQIIKEKTKENQSIIISCSSLKRKYRDTLRGIIKVEDIIIEDQVLYPQYFNNNNNNNNISSMNNSFSSPPSVYPVQFIFLHGSLSSISSRFQSNDRIHHFMPISLLSSQFSTCLLYTF